MSAEYFELDEEEYPSICYQSPQNDVLVCLYCQDEVYYTDDFVATKVGRDLFMKHKGCNKCGGIYFERICI